MTIQQKLRTIQKRLGLTQTKLAERFGVSFMAFNNWWLGKSVPRPRMRTAIEGLYLEATSQKSSISKRKHLDRDRWNTIISLRG